MKPSSMLNLHVSAADIVQAAAQPAVRGAGMHITPDRTSVMNHKPARAECLLLVLQEQQAAAIDLRRNLQFSPCQPPSCAAAAAAAGGAAAGAAGAPAATAYFVRAPPFPTLLIYWHSKNPHLEMACAMPVDKQGAAGTAGETLIWIDGSTVGWLYYGAWYNTTILYIWLVITTQQSLMTWLSNAVSIQNGRWPKQPNSRTTATHCISMSLNAAFVTISSGHVL